jgi:hypothetical protein
LRRGHNTSDPSRPRGRAVDRPPPHPPSPGPRRPAVRSRCRPCVGRPRERAGQTSRRAVCPANAARPTARPCTAPPPRRSATGGLPHALSGSDAIPLHEGPARASRHGSRVGVEQHVLAAERGIAHPSPMGTSSEGECRATSDRLRRSARKARRGPPDLKGWSVSSASVPRIPEVG